MVFIKKNLGLHIKQYCKVHKEETTQNSYQQRNKGAICMGPSGNLQGGFNFMSLRSMQKITRRSWDMILIPDTVIYRINILVKYKQELLVFTDWKGRLIGDGDVYLIGLDGDGDENEAPLKFGNENDLDYQKDQEEVHPNKGDQTTQQPVNVELEPSEEGPTIISQVPEITAPHTVQDMKPESPKETPGVHKSSRLNFQKKQYLYNQNDRL